MAGVSLPVFDLAALESSAERARLRDACESVGFFYVANHGVDPVLERRLDNQTTRQIKYLTDYSLQIVII